LPSKQLFCAGRNDYFYIATRGIPPGVDGAAQHEEELREYMNGSAGWKRIDGLMAAPLHSRPIRRWAVQVTFASYVECDFINGEQTLDYTACINGSFGNCVLVWNAGPFTFADVSIHSRTFVPKEFGRNALCK
jgi:hypothetical protein